MSETFFLLDEADDDDDPEYNFLEDRDEPDTEDFRTDRAVRITSESHLLGCLFPLWNFKGEACSPFRRRHLSSLY